MFLKISKNRHKNCGSNREFFLIIIYAEPKNVSIKKRCLNFGQKEVTTKDFYRQRQITDIFTIDVNRIAVSDKVSCSMERNVVIL